MIYFDNAATSFRKPKSVISAFTECIRRYCGNPGRSAHYYAIKSSEKIYEARETIAEFLNSGVPENVVFTMNATYALNVAIKTSVSSGDHVIISDMEHNSVLRPVEAMKSRGLIDYGVFKTGADVESELESLISEKTKCVVVNLSSNVNGDAVSLKPIFKLRQKYGFCLMVDASQKIGHEKIDLSANEIDVLCAPSHKALFGIQGAGFCVFCDQRKRDSFIEGGSGNESVNVFMPQNLPERFEAGTLPVPSIVSLNAGIKFINEIGLSEIEKKLGLLNERAIEILHEFNSVDILGAGCGIVGFNFGKTPSHLIAEELSKSGICVRSGLHCAPLAHKKLGTLETGSVRLSFSWFNDFKELDRLYKSLKFISYKY